MKQSNWQQKPVKPETGRRCYGATKPGRHV